MEGKSRGTLLTIFGVMLAVLAYGIFTKQQFALPLAYGGRQG